MKAFRFRLDSALRWRATQMGLEQEAVSRHAARVAACQTELTARYTELRSGSSELRVAGSAAFQSWAAYLDRSRRRIGILEVQLREAKKDLNARMQKLVEAHQKLRVLENLKRDDQAAWQKDLNRETEAFAAEAFLARSQRNSPRG